MHHKTLPYFSIIYLLFSDRFMAIRGTGSGLGKDGLGLWILELLYDLGSVWIVVPLTLNLFPELRAALVAFLPSGNGEIQPL